MCSVCPECQFRLASDLRTVDCYDLECLISSLQAICWPLQYSNSSSCLVSSTLHLLPLSASLQALTSCYIHNTFSGYLTWVRLDRCGNLPGRKRWWGCDIAGGVWCVNPHSSILSKKLLGQERWLLFFQHPLSGMALFNSDLLSRSNKGKQVLEGNFTLRRMWYWQYWKDCKYEEFQSG